MDSSDHLSDRQPMKNPSPEYSGIKKKAYELLCPIHCDPPHLLCLTEHHFQQTELHPTYIEIYVLGAKYCRHYSERGCYHFCS
jgi:hypothetical protein